MNRRAVFVLTSVLASCTDDQTPEEARAVRAEILAADYRSWERAPGFETRQPSRASHGESVDIFINDVVAEALRSEETLREWPIGSVIVKDGFDGSRLKFVAVMQKRENGWFWAEYDGDGDTLFSGTPEICVGCHTVGDDYTRAVFLPTRFAEPTPAP